MSRRLRTELRLLRMHALVSTPLVIILVFSAFQGQQRTRFEVIDVERINVVEPDGSYRLVISNRPRSDGPIYKGEPFGYPGGTRPGMIFFNDEGTENGGMTFTGSRQADGTYRASSHFAFDQFDQDQVLYLNYADNSGRRRLGLTVADRAVTPIFDLVKKRDSIMEIPDSAARRAALEELMGPVDGQPMFAQRVYVGRDMARAAVVSLSDPQGRARIRMVVDSLGAASLEFLDPQGEVVERLPSER